MLAIPSPDVLLNLFASAAQAMGLLAVCLSGGLLARRSQGAGAHANARRWPFWAATTLLAGVSASLLLYHLSVVDRDQQRLRTNLVRSSSEAGKAVGDASLKTRSHGEQERHARGLTTEHVQELVDTGRPVNLVDVREAEEVEMGAIAGSWARRYPDLQADPEGLVVGGRETVLLCESGNRSSELCDWFHEQGIATKFMIGGYEKWVAEGRPMTGGRGESDDLRALPEFPNKAVLLDTAAATHLFLEENALFVDVRYPKDFESGHLPEAVNIPLRKLRSDEAEAGLAALPRRPIIAPCYDKRSSFYALILGIKLARMGHDFRGRYTVPHEFALPQKDSAWVARWKDANADKTLLGEVRSAFVAALGWLRQVLGSLGLAILAAALLLRLLFAPSGAKADRDAIVQRDKAGELATLRQSHRGDPIRLRRALFAWYRAHRLTPGRNVLATLAQLLLFTALFAAVDRVCTDSTERFLWFPLAAPDAVVLPGLAGLLLLAIVWLQGRQGFAAAKVLGLVFTAAITALVVGCRAGTQLYLAASFALLLLQTTLVRLHLRPHGAPRLPRGLVPLYRAAGQSQLGGKAQRLGELLAAGLPVPPGFVVPHGYAPTTAELERACRRLGCARFAVRSSAEGEDGAEKSFAGEFRTLLDVPCTELPRAIAAVRASYAGRRGGVIVQALVPAERAGVLFTEDPAHSGRMLVEMIEGLGEDLVAGTANPTAVRIGRVSGLVVEGKPPIELAQLLEFGRQLEARFGVPQDIEWAWADGRFLLLQSRNVTRRAGCGHDPVAVREAERARLLAAAANEPADRVLYAASDFATLLPEPTPYSLALMQALWAPGGSVDLACRRIGFDYRAHEGSRPYVTSVFGRCCIDAREQRARIGIGAAAGFRLGAAARMIDRAFSDDFVPGFLRAARHREALDLARLELTELLQLHADTRARFVERTYVEAEVVNLAAEQYVATARRRLARRGLSAAAILGEGLSTVVEQAFGKLAGDGTLAQRVAAFVQVFGHRAQHDFEVSEPRFRERVDQVVAMAQAIGNARTQPQPGLPRGRLLRAEIERARRFQVLKELAKDVAMRELAELRTIVLEVGRRLGLGDRVFEFTPHEVEQLADPAFARRSPDEATSRQQRRRWLLAVPVPLELSAADLETIGEQRPLPANVPGSLRGLRVAGANEVTGRVVVRSEPVGLERLGPEHVLVVRCTDPCWLPAFGRIAGLVTEVGGWLSHAAIQAREHGLAAIVGVPGATAALRDGDLVRLHRDGRVERIADRRRSVRHPVEVPITIRNAGGSVSGRMLDLTDRGAAVAWDGEGPPREATFAVGVHGVELEARLAWTNCTRFGVRFTAPLPEQLQQALQPVPAPAAAATRTLPAQ